MKWMIDLDRIPNYVRVDTEGNPSPDDFVSMWSEVIGSAFWKPGMTVLIDDRKRKPMKEPDEIVERTANFFAQNSDRIGKACIAAISVEPENFKYARQLQYGIRLRGSDAVLQLFGTETQAVRWLDYYCKLREQDKSHTAAL